MFSIIHHRCAKIRNRFVAFVLSGAPDSEGSELAACGKHTVGDNGFRMTLSAEVPSLIENTLPDVLARWLQKRGLSIPDIGCYAIHPGGPRILDAVGNCLNLTPYALESSREILSQCGNMSSPTVLFIVEKLLDKHQSFPMSCACIRTRIDYRSRASCPDLKTEKRELRARAFGVRRLVMRGNSLLGKLIGLSTAFIQRADSFFCRSICLFAANCGL